MFNTESDKKFSITFFAAADLNVLKIDTLTILLFLTNIHRSHFFSKVPQF